MGTSGSYGGSSKQPWRDARQKILDLPSDSAIGLSESDQPDDVDPLHDLWSTIATALDSDDPTLHAPSIDDPRISLPSLIPWLSRSGGRSSGSGGSGGSAPIRTGGGRQGSGSRRQVVRSAARGGAALGAAYAIRSGDSEYLAELGLDLSHLQGLSPARQCAEILDVVLGEGSHPDELALRRASLQSLKEILAQDEVPTQGETLRSFVVNYVFELSLVELQRQLNSGGLAGSDAVRKERAVRSYLEKRVRNLPSQFQDTVHPSELHLYAAKLTQEAVKLLRATPGNRV